MSASIDDSRNERKATWRSCFGAALALILVLALSCAASPQLHHWLHGDEAADSDHHCLVLTLQLGKIEMADTAAVEVVRPERNRVDFTPNGFSAISCGRIHPLPSERGPPSST
ncbi:MAG: hypothetical protein JNN07_24775 [Verrucomicrobiales bacterium]|nr:hypothetical protein [Verrucomicrobiales bacterium]